MSGPVPDGVAEAARLLEHTGPATPLQEQVEAFEAVLVALTDALSAAED